jgi:hypothetical protein
MGVLLDLRQSQATTDNAVPLKLLDLLSDLIPMDNGLTTAGTATS